LQRRVGIVSELLLTRREARRYQIPQKLHVHSGVAGIKVEDACLSRNHCLQVLQRWPSTEYRPVEGLQRVCMVPGGIPSLAECMMDCPQPAVELSRQLWELCTCDAYELRGSDLGRVLRHYAPSERLKGGGSMLDTLCT